MSNCVIPGSFDPVTKGHMEIIRKAAKIFDRVTVTVMINVHKSGTILPKERVRILEKCLHEIGNAKADLWEGLLADYMRLHRETCVVRGVRNSADCEAEMTSAAVNRQLNPAIQTILIPADGEMSCISSSAVREIASFGGDPRPFLPEEAAEEIMRALSKQ